MLRVPENQAEIDEVLIAAFNNQAYQEPAGYPAKEMAAELMGKIKVRKLFYLRAVAAAAILIIAVTFGVFGPQPPTKIIHQPGGNKASLTLANGEVIVLDSAPQGIVSHQSGSTVSKVSKGKISYTQDPQPAATTYNTLTTPRGGEYQLTLPDGTLVWLNSASTITFPVAFNGHNRKVTIVGEAYFDVAKDPAKPFIVSAAGEMVEVLGTRFNIMAYKDEPAIQTTLISGKIKVSDIILSPGQQVQHNIVRQIDTLEAVAWIHGKLSLKYVDVPAFMRQVSRWYNIDVVYKGPVPAITFSGSVSRMVSLSQLLAALNANGIHAVIENGKLVVSKNQ